MVRLPNTAAQSTAHNLSEANDLAVMLSAQGEVVK